MLAAFRQQVGPIHPVGPEMLARHGITADRAAATENAGPGRFWVGAFGALLHRRRESRPRAGGK